MKKILEHLSKYDTIFNRMIISFIVLVIVVTMALDAFVVMSFSSKYNEKVEYLEMNSIQNLEEDLNSLFEDANRIVIEIASMNTKDEDIQAVFNKNVDSKYYKANKVLNYLSILATQNDTSVESIEYYSVKNNLWISTNAGIRYLDMGQADIVEGTEIFQKDTTFKGFRRWLAIRDIEKDKMQIPVYSYTAGYPLYTQVEDKFKGYIVINLKQSAVLSMLDDNQIGNYGAIAIMDPDGNIVISAGNTELLDAEFQRETDLQQRFLNQMDKQNVIRTKHSTVIGQKIGQEDWIVIELLSKREFYNEVTSIQIYSLLFSLAVVAIGIVLSYFFAKSIYQPLYLIMNKLNRAKLNKRVRENEYYYIDRAIDELSAKAIDGEQTLHANISSIRQDFVQRLISGKWDTEEEIQEKMQLLGCESLQEHHYLLLVKFHKKICDSLEPDKMRQIYQKTLEFFHNYSNQHIYCIAADLENNGICVYLNIGEQPEEEMCKLRYFLNDYMRMNFMLNPILIQSREFERLQSAGKQYNMANTAAQYIYFLPQQYLFELAEIQDMLENQKDNLDPQFELFTENLVARNAEQIEAILKHFVETPYIFQIPVRSLHSIILKYVFLYNYYLRDTMKEHKNTDDTQLYKTINDLYDVEDFYFWFTGLIRTTFDEMAGMEENPKNTVIKLIQNVIEDSIEEESLSLDYIAEKVYLSPKYVSRVFKEETGVKVTQYITDYKLEKATGYLIETNMSIEELIKKIGFSSSNYFIKKFKEKYFVTPTQYRRNSIEQGN